jgi:hypothetical protein
LFKRGTTDIKYFHILIILKWCDLMLKYAMKIAYAA